MASPLADAVDLSRISPLTLSGERLLPVPEGLDRLFPRGGIQRGTTVAVEGGPGVVSVALALVVEAVAKGSWLAVVGFSGLGLVAASELGVDLTRVALVGDPGREAAAVLAALTGAFDLVLIPSSVGVGTGDSRRLSARMRERGTVLVTVKLPGRSPRAARRRVLSPDLTLRVTESRWAGLGRGWGRLDHRRVRVESRGRGNASRPTRIEMWLPGPDGRLCPVEPAEPEGNRFCPVEPVEPAESVESSVVPERDRGRTRLRAVR